MTERRMRELERDGGVAWLRERERRGDLERSMVELAAYCGDAEALELVGEWTPFIPGCVTWEGRGIGTTQARWKDIHSGEDPHWTFERWLRGLERWPGALREAVVVVARMSWSVSMAGVDTLGGLDRDNNLRDLRGHLRAAVNHGGGVVLHALRHAGEFFGEQRVREAISARLIEWALR